MVEILITAAQAVCILALLCGAYFAMIGDGTS